MDELTDGEAHLLAGGLAYADDRLEEASREFEAAFRAFCRDGATRRAARVATLLGEVYADGLGKPATGRGWLERARRLLEDIGPCVEWGYWELALMACDRTDVEGLAASAERALQIADAYDDAALHVRALADSGVALVSSGEVGRGLARLDEALACITAGEVTDPFILGTTFCGLLSAAERIGDVERVGEWVAAIRGLVLGPTGGRPRVLKSHCSIALGGVFVNAGRWSEAEELLQEALTGEGPARLSHRVDAVARLADLRLRQGRFDEAAVLVSPFEDHVAVAAPLAAMHLAAGEVALAAAVVRRALNQLVGDALRAAPLLMLLVDAELAAGRVDEAADAVSRLHNLSEKDVPLMGALAALASGRVAAARGEQSDAALNFEEALRQLTGSNRPDLIAIANLDLAEAESERGNRDGAIAAARAAHAGAERLAAAPLRDRAASILRQLDAAIPRSAATRVKVLATLTEREQDVLDGLRRGETNAAIAARLYLSPKTIEHHVSRLLAKLGAKTRAEAAALAAASER